MSKSLKRVIAALDGAKVASRPIEMSGETRTAAQAAQEAGCCLDQIAKSILFRGATSDKAVLFVTAGGNRVDPAKAAQVAGEPLERADIKWVRSVTGFAIGGVAPIGHLVPPVIFFDPKLLGFDEIWAAAGTPRHIFAISPQDLLSISSAQIADFTQ
ncbi:Cys-tRNA(Pro)/Cys-tRNA(Cys) deacylase YbaK [Aquimixticola soesokkakensis]|uniref:Cys-tRNA(Pro)/Cys-tRNA(Cys) deacylase YbaK n=1 Tax=Aquimixticola soesokkakensis TaxID=1519096 RepID=A0A1Y5SS82_9RHOB|nr:YbaK/EbsC family protein [Aquimixticola soesokkakensis]SLN43975.1 Cys-tRNA(Pro)/Cys-tRNA(Cys) deacylase YbaK [Aquimixticola soesokkakensis]